MAGGFMFMDDGVTSVTLRLVLYFLRTDISSYDDYDDDIVVMML